MFPGVAAKQNKQRRRKRQLYYQPSSYQPPSYQQSPYNPYQYSGVGSRGSLSGTAYANQDNKFTGPFVGSSPLLYADQPSRGGGAGGTSAMYYPYRTPTNDGNLHMPH